MVHFIETMVKAYLSMGVIIAVIHYYMFGRKKMKAAWKMHGHKSWYFKLSASLAAGTIGGAIIAMAWPFYAVEVIDGKRRSER